MGSERITNRQACILTILYVMTNSFSVMYGVSAGRDVWIAYILAAAASCLLWFLLSEVSDKYPGTDFFVLLRNVFGRPISWVITLLLALYAFSSIASSVADFGKFTQLTALSKTPQMIIPLFLLLLSAYVLRSGIEVLARCASLLTPFVVFVFIYFLLFGIGLVRGETLTPILANGILPVTRSALSVFVNHFGRNILLAALLHNIKKSKKGRGRGILAGVIIGSGAVCLIALSTVATLGQSVTSSEFYPVFTVLSIRNVGGFIQHMEILTSIATAFFIFFRTAIGLYFLSRATAHLFCQKNFRAELIPLALLSISMTQLLYRNTMYLRKSVESNMSIALIVPLQFAIPVIFCAIAYFKKTREQKKLK